MDKQNFIDSKNVIYAIVTVFLGLLAYASITGAYQFAKSKNRLDLVISGNEQTTIVYLSIAWVIFFILIIKLKSYAWGLALILGGISILITSGIFLEGWHAAVGIGGLLVGSIFGILLLVINFFIKIRE